MNFGLRTSAIPSFFDKCVNDASDVAEHFAVPSYVACHGPFNNRGG
jgi:hypothetical protein